MKKSGTNPLRQMLFAEDGPWTEDLRQTSGSLGVGRVPSRLAPDGITRSVCGYCGTGCTLETHIKDGQAVNVTPVPEGPVNLGMACPKGWQAMAPLTAPDRATVPLLRRSKRDELRPVSWHEAATTFCSRMKAILHTHGPESVAFLSTGQIPMEEMAFLGSFAKFGMGLIHGDGNTRQCMATAVVAHKRSFGFDAPPYTYADLELSDVLVFVGANPCIAHPILWERVVRNQNDPKIVVVDPRRTETAMAADEHVAIAPKADLALLYAVAERLLQLEAVDQSFVDAHTEGFDDFVAFLSERRFLDRLEQTGVEQGQFERIVQLIARGERVSFWWTMGVNQSHEGVRVAQAIINLALMTGNIGRPGTGANSITGQCNAMGSRLFSNTTNLLGGHDFADPEHRSKVAGVLDISADRIPQQSSDAYDQILESVLSGRTKALWIIATNPKHSWIAQPVFEEILERLDFLVVQDMYKSTETAEVADLVLPAAGWGEKEGTFINAERRIGRIRAVHRAPGQALSDFRIFRLLAEYWGVGEMFRQWTTPEAVFEILQECTRGQPCDFTGIEGYAALERACGIQWPCPEGTVDPEPERRLFGDGVFFRASGRALFEFEQPRAVPEPTTKDYPWVLLTGRGSSSQWHTGTRTSKSAVLRSLYPQTAYVEISRADADRLGVSTNDPLIVQSQRASVRVRAAVSTHVRPGQVFMAMHYPETNRLTFPAFDPYSREPAYKACAVAVRAPHHWERA